MKKINIFIMLILANLSIFCQNIMKNEIHPIKELEVINSNLFSVLDTIIQMKEKIKLYKGTDFFTVEFDEDSVKTDLIFIRAYEKINYRYPDIHRG